MMLMVMMMMLVMMTMMAMVMVMMIVSSGTARDWGSGWWRRLLEAQRAGFLQLGAREASSRSNSDEPRSPSNGAERPRPRPEGQDRNLRVKIAISGTLPLQCSKGQYRFCRLLYIAHVGHYRHYRRWCTFFKPAYFFPQRTRK